jgi:hypothetical protein
MLLVSGCRARGGVRADRCSGCAPAQRRGRAGAARRGRRAFVGACAVAFEREWAFAGPEHRLDPLAHRAERPGARSSVAAVRAQEVGVQAGHERFELFAGEALVSQDGVAVEVQSFELVARAVAFTEVRREQLVADWHAVRRTQQIQFKAAEMAAVAGAVAVGATAGQLRAPRRFARLAARHRCRIEQPHVVSKRRRQGCEMTDARRDLRRQTQHALVSPTAGADCRTARAISFEPSARRPPPAPCQPGCCWPQTTTRP